MRYYLIAGEASGDLHASNLMKALKKIDKDADFRFLGGDLMAEVGGNPVKHYKEMAFMGFVPVLLNLSTIMRNMEICREDIRSWQPDVVILIDYPGFNLKIAKYVKRCLNIPVYYYISPKIWAWKKYRIKDFRKYVDKMFCILPFEKEFYKELNYPVEYVGNPTVDAVNEFCIHHADQEKRGTDLGVELSKPVIALLCGSRRQEIKDNLPVMINVLSSFPDYEAVIAGAPGIEQTYYEQFISGKNVQIVFDKTYPLLKVSEAALVTSGTATLETSLFRVPQVVCYYTPVGKFIGFVFRHFFHTPFISLVNLIAGREVVKELFADRFSEKNIRNELKSILTDITYRNNMQQGYDEVIKILGEPGASKRAAQLIYSFLLI